MSHRGVFRAFLSIVPASITAAALLGSTPARSNVTIDIPCSGTWSWNAATKTLSCAPDAPPAAGAPSCSLAATPSSLPAGGGPVTLTATCTNSPTSYQWSAAGVSFTGGSSTTVNTNGATITASTAFSVTATSDAGSGQASRTVQVGAVAAGAISCPGYSRTVVVNWDWSNGSLVKIDTWVTQNGLGTNGILVVPFIPTGPADNVMAQLSVTNYPAGQMVNTKRLAISTQPCDLNPPQVAGSANMAVGGSTPTVYYVLGTSPVSGITGKATAVALTRGVQYYINLAERQGVNNSDPDGTQSCVSGQQFYPNCELRLSLGKPSGH
jgi:hypothetical protein